MDDDIFTASNGWTVNMHGTASPPNGGSTGGLGSSHPAFTAVVQYGAHTGLIARDIILNRWRSENDPFMVVYQTTIGDMECIRTLDERTGNSRLWSRRPVGSGFSPEWDLHAAAAHEWHDAHVAPSPWDMARPGQGWLVTIGGEEQLGILDSEMELYLQEESINVADPEEAKRITKATLFWTPRAK